MKDYQNDIYYTKEILFAFCANISKSFPEVEYRKIYPMNSAILQLLSYNGKNYEIKITIKKEHIENPDGKLNNNKNKQFLLEALQKVFSYCELFNKTFWHAGNLLVVDLKKTYEVKLVEKRS
mgnify:CR=1 FL=1